MASNNPPSRLKPDISRLKETQEQSLGDCARRIAEWQRFEKDYLSLKDFLGTVPNKLTYDVMVPFGKLAFMPGHLVNTNNVLVLLGENWFVERSAKEAQEIAGRRLKACQDTLDNLEKERLQTLEWMKHTDSLLGGEDIQDIVEEYDATRDISRKDIRMQGRTAGATIPSHSKEEKNMKKTRVRFEDEKDVQHAVLTFKHSEREPLPHEVFQGSESLLSPGDIVRVFGPQIEEQKSILKVPKTFAKNQALPSNPEEASVPAFDSYNQAFTGTIVEKESSIDCNDSSTAISQAFVAVATEKPESEVQPTPVVEKSTRPVSRFKAQRSKK